MTADGDAVSRRSVPGDGYGSEGRVGRLPGRDEGATEDEPGPSRTSDDGSVGGATAPEPAAAWVFLSPIALAAAYGALALAVGPSVFDTGAPGFVGMRALVLLGALLFLAAWSTARLYDDARRVSADAVGWQPDPEQYVVVGALVLTLYPLARLALLGGAIERPVVYLLGTAVVALPLSSVVAGPVYLLRRRRHAG